MENNRELVLCTSFLPKQVEFSSTLYSWTSQLFGS